MKFLSIILITMMSYSFIAHGQSYECRGVEADFNEAEFTAGYLKAFDLTSMDDIDGLQKIPKWRIKINLRGMQVFRMIMASYPKTVVKVFYTYIKIFQDSKIFLKLVRSLVGKASWSKQDTTQLKKTLADIPKMIVTRGVRWVIPGGAILYAGIASSSYAKLILPNAYFSAKPPENLIRYFETKEGWFNEGIDELKEIMDVREEILSEEGDISDASKEVMDAVYDVIHE